MTQNWLARFADNIFWLARYMERAENLARVIDVTETHARNRSGVQDWTAILEMNTDLKRFRDTYGNPDLGSVLQFYIIDRTNPTSIASNIANARENARTIRHLISTEMWTQLNVLNTECSDLKKRDITPRRVSGVCQAVKQACQAHAGITEGTLYQDEGWCFYGIGKSIERADQTSRLIDIGYRRIMLSGYEIGDRALDPLWTTLLRSAAGYQAFRRAKPIRMRPEEVLGFLVADSAFPRSLYAALSETQYYLMRLFNYHQIGTVREALAAVDDIRAKLVSTDPGQLIKSGVHGPLDELQQELIVVTNHLRRDCFGHKS
ncbi:MAG: alpha-E domain-containing protein [Rhodospirillales bacterium]